MKKLILFLTSMLMVSIASLQAQQTYRPSFFGNRLSPQTQQILLRQWTQNTEQKTTTTEERLIAESYYHYGVPQQMFDSTKYMYSGPRGNVFIWGFPFFGEIVAYGFPVEFYPLENILLNTDAYSNYDSVHYYSDQSTIDERYLKFYDASGKLVKTENYNITNDQSRCSLNYNSNAQVASIETEGGQGTFDPVINATFRYQGQDRIEDSIFSYDFNEPGSKMMYTYSAGRLVEALSQQWISLQWENLSKTIYAYDGSNRLVSSLGLGWLDNSWENYWLDSFAYQGANTHPSYSMSKAWDSSNWENSNYENYTFNASGTVDSSMYYLWNNGNWELEYKAKYSYNAMNHLTKEFRFFSDNSKSEYYYYYEQYTTGVNEVLKGMKLTISPNPSSGKFTVSASSITNESVTISITNLFGQKIYETQSHANKDMEISLDTPAGLYFVTVATEKGRCTEKIIIE